MDPFDALIGESPAWRALRASARTFAPTGLSIVLHGETGTGKEQLARALHAASGRAGPFVAVDCGALNPALIESELFGHVRGAFTDARGDRDGLVARADRGTLFLDEVAELPLALQTRLLRLTQEGSIRPVGGDVERTVDVRIIAASHRDLAVDVREGRFRADLYHRLALARLDLPPLRARPDDIDRLTDHFLAAEAARHGIAPRRPSPALRAHLRALPWPGNLRELRNACAVLAVLPRAEILEIEDLPAPLQSRPEAVSAAEADLPLHLDLPYHAARERWLDAFQARYVAGLLARYDGNVSRAADAAGIDRRTLQRLRARLAERPPDDDADG
jgi:DNA-binding NtrC family response regulator